MRPLTASVLALVLLAVGVAPACELCAIYSASSARGEDSSGFTFTLSESFIRYGALQKEGNRYRPGGILAPLRMAYLDSSVTHLVPGYNISPRLGVNLNLPIVYRSFRRVQLPPTGLPLIDETGTVSGIGDAALIGRWTAFQKMEMKYSMLLNILAGVKFPTGDNSRVRDEVAQERAYNVFFGGPGHNHPIGGIHQHDLSPGSGSFDGVLGTALNLRWQRYFFNQQLQYYLRTEADDYRFGNTFIVSGGPGFYALLNDGYTLSIQANAFYENTARDKILGLLSPQTGTTAWYLGPLIAFTWGEHFSANAGIDVPLRIANNGVQSVPDYRVHGGLSWRF